MTLPGSSGSQLVWPSRSQLLPLPLDLGTGGWLTSPPSWSDWSMGWGKGTQVSDHRPVASDDTVFRALEEALDAVKAAIDEGLQKVRQKRQDVRPIDDA